jgi:5-methylcytosine-specific restriction endonuclease McrA
MRKLKIDKECTRCSTIKNIEQCFYIGKDKKGIRTISSYCIDCYKSLEKEPIRIQQRKSTMANYYERKTGKTKEQREKERLDKIKPKVRKVYLKICIITGKPFVGNSSKSYYDKTCGITGDYKTTLNLALSIRRNGNKHKCDNCNKEYTLFERGGCRVNPQSKTLTKYCSKECKKTLTEQVKKEEKARTSQTRRARKKSVISEPIWRKKVFERDNYKCYICGCKVYLHKQLTFAKDKATLDHIIPLSKGGSHTYGNIKTACGLCNSYKCDSIIEVKQIDIFSNITK